MNISDVIDKLAPYGKFADTARHNHRALISNLACLAHHSKRGRGKGVSDARTIAYHIVELLASEYETYWEEL
jgi:hypothetical protein